MSKIGKGCASLCLIGVALALVVIWLYLVLIVRIAMLYIIVGIAPIAFMAYIMPFTEQYYKQWWAAFWKWAFMGPAVAFMLWLSQKFLTEGYFGTKQAQTEATIETWVWLIGAGVLLWLAATLPLKMGKEIYGSIQKGINKTAPAKAIKEGWKQRQSAVDQRRADSVRRARRFVAKTPLVGGVMTGINARKQAGQMWDEDVAAAQKRRGMESLNNSALQTIINKGNMTDATGAMRILADRGFLKVDENNADRISTIMKRDQKAFGSVMKSNKHALTSLATLGKDFEIAPGVSGAETAFKGNMKDWKPDMFKHINQKEMFEQYGHIVAHQLGNKQNWDNLMRETDLGTKEKIGQIIKDHGELETTLKNAGITQQEIDYIKSCCDKPGETSQQPTAQPPVGPAQGGFTPGGYHGVGEDD